MNRRVWSMIAFLGAQIAIFYSYPRIQDKPIQQPLSSLPTILGGWEMIKEVPLAADELRLLSADETLNRYYRAPSTASQDVVLNLFSAYFKSQRGRVAPHSPKVCLLGGGWVPTESGTRSIRIGGREITVNQYILSKSGRETFLLYWFAPERRIFANEYAAKFDTLWRSFFQHRNDTSFVRITVPYSTGGEAEAARAAVSFVQTNFEQINHMFPD